MHNAGRILMKHPRRTFLQLAAGAAALPAVSRLAWAEGCLSQPVHIVIGFAPGSAPDIVARLLSPALSEQLGQPVIIENQPGAGGNFAADTVAQAAPDGTTLLMVGASHAISTTLYDRLGFDFRRDIAPVAAAVQLPIVMLVRPAAARSVPAFIAQARANPGALKMASAGVGSTSHLAGELFKMKTGIELVHVPYRGGEGAYADLLDGTVDVYFASLASAMGYIQAGQLRALAASTRQEILDVPTLAAVVPGYAASSWYGIGAPSDTPATIVDQLNAAINNSLAEPGIKAQIAALGGTIVTGSPADFGALVAAETETWAKVIATNRAIA
jgi:tripartite-type tricarboxylate transporter receptor subunit TctC